tara:strand:- start:993 stop:1898 length:906 start_codon:yes stop_codon:yes gene_type:complete
MKTDVKANSTEALYFEGTLKSIGKIVNYFSFPEGLYICTNRSPFHPEDYLGGDQPGDIGKIKIEDIDYQVVDSKVLVINAKNGKLEYPASKSELRKGIEENIYVVQTGHFIIFGLENLDLEKLLDKKCLIEVDMNFRAQLSKTHTTIHLMSIVLNEDLAEFWTKIPTMLDVFGNPNFDALAIVKSKIFPLRAVDSYRLGKSLKKKGFDIQKFWEADLEEISKKMSQRLNKLILNNKKSTIIMKGNGNDLGDRRSFNIKINNKDISIPCGGTHLNSLSSIEKVKVNLKFGKKKDMLIVETNL